MYNFIIENIKDENEFKDIIKDLKTDLLYYDRESEYFRHGIITEHGYFSCYPHEQGKTFRKLKEKYSDISDENIIKVYDGVYDGELLFSGIKFDENGKIQKVYLSNKLLDTIKGYMDINNIDRITVNGKCYSFTELKNQFKNGDENG